MSFSQYKEIMDVTGVCHYVHRKSGEIEFSILPDDTVVYPDGTTKKLEE